MFDSLLFLLSVFQLVGQLWMMVFYVHIDIIYVCVNEMDSGCQLLQKSG